MILKIENVGSTSQTDEQERFTAYLIKKLKPKDTELFELMISAFTEKELKELYKLFQTMEGSLFAKMGTKLDYLTRLNGKCPEGYEIEKFMAGGCAKCKKKVLTFQNSGQVKLRITLKINPSDTVQVNGQPRSLHHGDGKPIVKGMKVYSALEYQKDRQDAAKGKRDAAKRVAKSDDKTMFKCGGKSKKRITKHKCGSAFKKVNGGPGSIDSTRDMKPNKKQRKMIKKHLGGTTEGGITFREDLNPPTQGVMGELKRNVQQGADLFERMTRMPRRVVATAAGARYAPAAAKTVVNSNAAKVAGDKAWKAVAATGPVGILGVPTMAIHASGLGDALAYSVYTGGNTDKGISNWTKENIVTPTKNGAISYWNWMTGMTK